MRLKTLALQCIAALAALTTAPRAEAQGYLGQSSAYPDANSGLVPFSAFRFGGDLGFATIEHQNYFVINGTGMLRVSPFFRVDFVAPLRFSTADFSIRQQDWDEAVDFARIPQCIRLDLGDFTPAPDRFDRSCDDYEWRGHGIHDRTYFSARVAPLRGITLGNGTLVYSFRNSISPSHPQLGLQTNFDLRDWGYVRGFVDDVLQPRVLGGRVALRPQQAIFQQNWDETPDDGEVGFTAVTDLTAPSRILTAFGRPITDGAGNLRYDGTSLTAIGVDAHYLYLWGFGQSSNPERIGLFAFADYNRFLELESGDAFHSGVRFVYRNRQSQWDFRIGAEYRYQGNRYLPEYFDSNYAVQREQYALNRDTQGMLGTQSPTTTKLSYLMSRPVGYTHGFQAWMRLVIPIPTSAGQQPNLLPIQLFAEDAGAPNSASISALVGPFQLDQLLVAAMYERRNFNSLEHMFELDGAMVRVVGRLYLAPSSAPPSNILRNIYLSAQYDRRFFLADQNQYSITNDFVATVGYSTGTN